MIALLLVHRHKLQRAAACEHAATQLQALVRGHATRRIWELALRVLVMEKARTAAGTKSVAASSAGVPGGCS
eukprot:6086371-Prymnesium_polylepis.1